MSYLQAFKQTGAATNRRTAKRNPYELIIQLREERPTDSWDALFDRWKKAVHADDALEDAVDRYAYANFTAQYDRDNTKPRPRRSVAAEVAKNRAEAIKATAKAIRDVVLMNLTLPNGKRLRDATFADCGRAGGWFKVLATKGKPSEVVGKKLTENDLWALK
jgi:hypothetical protein